MKRGVLNYLVIVALAVSAAFTSCDKCECGYDKVKLLETITYNGELYCKFEYDNNNRITRMISYGEGFDISTGETVEWTEECTLEYDTFGDVISEDYWDSGFITGTISFPKSENKITIDWRPHANQTKTYELFNDDFPFKYELAHYSAHCTNSTHTKDFVYQNDNIIRVSWQSAIDCNNPYSSGTIEYTFDNKKSPFYHCKTPKWYLLYKGWNLDELIVNKNNVITETHFTEFEPETGYAPVTTTVTYFLEHDDDGFLKSRTGTYYGETYTYSFTYKTYKR